MTLWKKGAWKSRCGNVFHRWFILTNSRQQFITLALLQLWSVSEQSTGLQLKWSLWTQGFNFQKFNASTRNNESILASRRNELEKEPSDFEKSLFMDQEEELSLKSGTTNYGKLAIELFQCEKWLLPNTKFRRKMIRARSNFYLISYNPHVPLKFLTVPCLQYVLLLTKCVTRLSNIN